jgi:hypothetical protein
LAESFELLDGSRYYYDPTSPELFLHFCNCAKANSAHNWPEPPELVRKLCEAKNPRAVLKRIYPEGPGSFYSLVYDPEVLISERRLEPRGLVTRYDPETGEHHVRDPYEECDIPDLSE